MKFLLDTNVCIYSLKQNAKVPSRLLAESRPDVAISVIPPKPEGAPLAKRPPPMRNSAA